MTATDKFREIVDTVSANAPHKRSKLEAARAAFQPQVPSVLLGGVKKVEKEKTTSVADQDKVQARFPNLYGSPIVDLVPSNKGAGAQGPPLNIGVVLSGGQAAGGHNCICGIYDYAMKNFPGSKIFGFLGGPKGVMENTYKLLDDETIDAYRNSGGFTMLAAGRDKIESPEQFAMATQTAKTNDLDGLVVIGGDDSNTNACLLGEHYFAAGIKCKVRATPAPFFSPCSAVFRRVSSPPRALSPRPPAPSPTPARALSARSSACPRLSTAISRMSTARLPSASTRPPSCAPPPCTQPCALPPALCPAASPMPCCQPYALPPSWRPQRARGPSPEHALPAAARSPRRARR